MLDFAALFHNSPDLGLITDLRGTVLAATRAAEERLGYPTGGLSGVDLASISEGSEVADFFVPGRAGTSRLRAPFRLRTRSGGQVVVDAAAFALRDASGADVGWFLAGMDPDRLGESRDVRTPLDTLVGEALRESEERYRTLAESSGVGIWQITPEGRSLYANPEMIRMLGLSGPAELEGLSYQDFFTPESVEAVKAEHPKRVAGIASSYEVEIVRRDGSRRRAVLYGAPLRTADGALKSRIGTFVDVTDRRRAEEALREAHEELERRVEERTALLTEEIAQRRRAQEHLRLYREIFANAREGILVLDRDGRVLEQNEAHRQLLGWGDEELRREGPALYGSPDVPALLKALAEAGPQRGETEERAKSGERLRIEFSAFTVKGAGGEPLCHVVIKRDVSARRRAEEALRESEGRWRALVDSAPAIILTVDRDGRILTMNRLREGWKREEVIGAPMWGFAVPEMAKRMKEGLERLFATGEPDRYELHGYGDKGTLAWYDSHVAPILSEGKVVAAIVVAQDITDRVEAKRRLEALADEQRLLLTHSRDFVYRHDVHGVFTYVSPAVEQITGHTVADWMTHYTDFLTDNPLNRRVIEFTDETLRSGKQSPPYLVEIFAKSRARILLEVNERAYYGADGSIAGIVGIARDVTERRRQDEELRFRKTLLESQSEAALEGILVVSPEGRMISFNRRFLEMWNIPPAVAESRSDSAALESVLQELADPQAFLARVKQLYDHPLEQCHDEIALKDGRVFDRYSAPVQDAEGKLYGRVWYFRDITGRKRTEEELRRAAQETRRAYDGLKSAQDQLIRSEKLASIGMLVSGVAHEINNPLNVMYGNLQLLSGLARGLAPKPAAKGKSGARKFRGMIRDALKAAEHARGIMEDFRSYARDVRTAELVDLNRCLEEAVSLLRPELKRRIRIVKRLGRVPPVRCFRGQMSQVFLNLLKNAAEAIEGRGVITLRSARRGDLVRIEVQDSGHGIAPEVRAKLFEPFFTTKPVGQGLGLGLSISAMILQNHGGRLDAENASDGGACFVVEVPIPKS